MRGTCRVAASSGRVGTGLDRVAVNGWVGCGGSGGWRATGGLGGGFNGWAVWGGVGGGVLGGQRAVGMLETGDRVGGEWAATGKLFGSDDGGRKSGIWRKTAAERHWACWRGHKPARALMRALAARAGKQKRRYDKKERPDERSFYFADLYHRRSPALFFLENIMRQLTR